MANIFVHDGGGGSGPTGYLQMDSGALLSATLNEVADQSNQFSCLWLSTIDVNNYGGGNQIGNTAFGPGALTSNLTSRYNIAIGLDALHSQTGSSGTGGSNIAIGPNALYSTNNSSGIQNIAIGFESQFTANGGGNNVSMGVNSLYSNVSGDNNVSIGTSALYSSISNDNVAVGYFALNELSFASNGNVAIGSESLMHFSGGGELEHINTAVGYQAMRGNPASSWSNGSNTAIGYQSLLFIDSNGQKNTAIGHQSQLGTTGNGAGQENTSVGYQSLNLAQSASERNTAIGSEAALNLTTSDDTIAIGHQALKTLSTRGHGSIAIGNGALERFVGNTSSNDYNNIAIGYHAARGASLGTKSGYDNIAIGKNALSGFTTCVSNTAIGLNTLSNIGSGSWNTVVGYGSAQLFNATSNYNTIIGSSNFSATPACANVIVLGYGNTSTPNTNTFSLILGNNNTATGSNQVWFGDPTSGQNAGTVTSAAATQTHYWSVFINGTSYKILLAT